MEQAPKIYCEVVKTFTTRRKKTSIQLSWKGAICYEKCRQLMEITLDLYPARRISTEDLEYLVQRYVGANRNTVRDYLGFDGRIGRNPLNPMIIGHKRIGYLERWGFAKRVKRNLWAIFQQTTIDNEEYSTNDNENNEVLKKATDSVSLINECLSNKKLESKEKISLSTSAPVIVEPELTSWTGKAIKVTKINNNNQVEREKFSLEHKNENILSPLELAIFSAKPLDKPPDKAKISWENDSKR